MNNYTMEIGYMSNEKLRRSFNRLAMDTFNINFEDWHLKNLFFDRYKCYSYRDGDEIIANVSINKMNLVIKGQKMKALQLGTVMTHPDYRNQGLSASLINHIIKEYENELDIIYLFANDSVLDFYPKFGFKKYIECSYELDANQLEKKEKPIRKLDLDNEEDYKTIMRLARNRQPISQSLGVYNDIWPLLVYCLYEYRDDLYYLADEDAAAILRREDGKLHLYDVISLKPVDLDIIIENIVLPEDTVIEFHFIPELCRYKAIGDFKVRNNDTLFVRYNNSLSNELLFPMTSHT